MNGALPLQRWVSGLGVLVLAFVCLFALDGAHGPFDEFRPFRVVFAPHLAERFEPWRSDGPDPRWAGCRLAAIDAGPESITLGLTCGADRSVTATLTPVGGRGGPSGDPQDCALAGAAGRWLRCNLTGASADERAALTTEIAKNLGAILPLDASRLVYAEDPHADRDRFRLLRPLQWTLNDALLSAVAFGLTSFLWLGLTGAFESRRWASREAVLLAPLGVALVLRLGVALSSIQEIEIHLYDGVLPTMHSVVVPILGRVLRVLPGDAHAHTFTLHALLASVAVVPLARFVSTRAGSLTAGVLVALCYACQPVVVRFAPTDSPYALMTLLFFQALAWLSAESPAILPAALALAIAASCRADGLLLWPVAAMLLGPRLLGSLWTTQRRQCLVAALVAGSLLVAYGATVLSLHLLPSGQLRLFWPHDVGLWVRETLAYGPAGAESAAEALARTTWQALALVGGIAGLLSGRLRWGLAALVGALVLTAPYPESWTWPVALHRVVPAATMLSLAAGAALSWLALPLSKLRPWARAAGVAGLAGVPVALALASTPLLTRSWVFNEEWSMVRDTLAPNGVEQPECQVLSFGSRFQDDTDIHRFEQMLFDTEVIDCWSQDCVALARTHGCHRYIRGLRCYYQDAGVADACKDAGLAPDDAQEACLVPECAAVEATLSLTPLDERVLRPYDSFRRAGKVQQFPEVAVVGVYEARSALDP